MVFKIQVFNHTAISNSKALVTSQPFTAMKIKSIIGYISSAACTGQKI